MDEKVKNFQNAFPFYLDKILEVNDRLINDEISTYTRLNFEKFLNHVIPHGRTEVGDHGIKLYFSLMEGEKPYIDEAELHITFWILQSGFRFAEVLDDPVDGSQMRWGLPCWYLIDNNRATLAPFCFQMFSLMYLLSERLYAKRPFFGNITKLLCEGSISASLEMGISILARNNLSELKNPEMFYYTQKATGRLGVVAAIAMPLYLAGHTKIPEEEKMTLLMQDMINVWSYTNDYYDLYNTSSVLGRLLNDDIRGGTLTWFAAKALANADEKQKSIFRENYGRNEEVHVQAILKLYKELNVLEEFEKFRKEFVADIIKRADTLEEPKIAAVIKEMILYLSTLPAFVR